MKKNLLTFVLALVLLFISMPVSANQPIKVEDEIKKMAEEYEKIEGVDCMVLEPGGGLGLVKGMFKSKFGSAFMKGVTLMVIIEYSKASPEFRAKLIKKIDSFSGVLQELSPNKGEEQKGQYVKSYGSINGTTSISDFMILMEEGDTRMLLYMGGHLAIDKLEVNM